MASGTLQMPEVRGGYVTSTFDGLFDYGNGLFILTTNSSDTHKPANYNSWMVVQFSYVASGFNYVVQFAIETSATMAVYMRKRRRDSGQTILTDWKTVTFS